MAQIGFIYKLCCRDPTITEVYIGSTKNLHLRKNQHKSKCNNVNCKEYNYHVYQFIRANQGFDNWHIIQLEEVEFNTKHELLVRERYFFELLNASLNMQVPNRTCAESKRNYAIEHRNEIYAKQNISHNCVCGGLFMNRNKSVHFATNKHLLYL